MRKILGYPDSLTAGVATSERSPRRNLVSVAVRALFAGVLTFGLAACSSSVTVDDPGPTPAQSGSANDDSEQAKKLRQIADDAEIQMAPELEAFDDVYSNIEVATYGSNVLEYRYTYQESFDTKQALGSLESDQAKADFDQAAKGVIRELEDNGISNPEVRWTYFKADGSELFSTTRK